MEIKTKSPRKYFDGRAYHRDYFETIHAQEKAYILGFLWGDGSYIPSKRTIALAIASVDQELLYAIASCLGLQKNHVRKHTVHGFPGHVGKCVKIQMSHKVFFESMQRLGYDKKPKRLLHLPKMPANMIRHFMRGLFDADGCVTYSKATKSKPLNHWNVSLSLPHQEAVRWCTELFMNEIKVDFSDGEDKSIYRISATSKRAVIAINDYFYRDATIFLARKRKKFDEIMAVIGPKLPPAAAMPLAA